MKLQNLIHILIGTVCIGLLPHVQAVSPAPDGAIPVTTRLRELQRFSA